MGGVAVLNADDPRVLAMAASTAARVVTFGRAADADVRAVGVTADEAGRAGFTLVTAQGSAPVQLRLYGEHHVSNALAAAALAGELGLATDAIAAGLSEALPRSRWRMEVTRRADGVTVVNDAYNANPESLRAALATLAVMTDSGRRHRAFAVLGLMTELGEAEEEFHEEAGGWPRGRRGRPDRGRRRRRADPDRGQGRAILVGRDAARARPGGRRGRAGGPAARR